MKEKKLNAIHIKVNKDEKRKIEENAKKRGLSVSAYIRMKSLKEEE